MSAMSGMATKTPTSTRWNVEDGSSSNSDLGWTLVAPPMDPSAAGAVVDEAWAAVVAVGRAGEVVTSVSLTVSGDVVILLLAGLA
jgi:hypothetical protein